MRLGTWKCITPNSLAHNIYRQTAISERHRHHYEYNELMLQHLKAGLKASGVNQIRIS
jgi:CTP synthase